MDPGYASNPSLPEYYFYIYNTAVYINISEILNNEESFSACKKAK